MTLSECLRRYGCTTRVFNPRKVNGFELANFAGGVVVYQTGTLLFVHTDQVYPDDQLLGLVRLADRQNIYELRLIEIISTSPTSRYRVEILDQGLYTPDQPLTNRLTY